MIIYIRKRQMIGILENRISLIKVVVQLLLIHCLMLLPLFVGVLRLVLVLKSFLVLQSSY